MRLLLPPLLTTLLLFGSGCDPLTAAQRMDTDGSGELTAREISQGLLDNADRERPLDALSESELRKAFAEMRLLREWDEDGDGRVTATDFVFLFANAGADATTQFSDWDENSDGRLSNEELAHALFIKFDLNRNQLLSRGEIEELFVFYGGIEAYDRDNNGRLSLAEIQMIAE